MWQRLKHENVLTLHGTVLNFGHYPAFVCPWLEKGSIGKYLEQQGDVLSMVDRLQLVRPSTAITLVLFLIIIFSCAKSRPGYLIVSDPYPTEITKSLMRKSQVHASDVIHGDLTGVSSIY